MISLNSHSKLGYAKPRIRIEGSANKIVMSKYTAKMTALAGITYKTIRRNMRTKGNLAVNWTKKTRAFKRDKSNMSTGRWWRLRFWFDTDICNCWMLEWLTSLPGINVDDHKGRWSPEEREQDFTLSPFLLSTIQRRKKFLRGNLRFPLYTRRKDKRLHHGQEIKSGSWNGKGGNFTTGQLSPVMQFLQRVWPHHRT